MTLNLKLAQKALFDILIVIDNTCRKYDIEYWIDGGTLLGAKRNGKFISWDDDIDICVLPDDYKKLVRILKENVLLKKKDHFLYNDHRPSRYITEYFTNSKVLQNRLFPYQVDIVIMKSLPNLPEPVTKDKSIMNIIHFFHFYKYKHPEQVLESDKKKHLQSGSFLSAKKRFYNFLVNDYCANLNEKRKDHIYCYPYNDMYVKRDREYYTYDDIFPLKEIEFEGHMFKCPNNTESYLTKLYGKNYMSPPPPEMQHTKTKNISKNVFPVWMVKKWLYIMYMLKDFKQAIQFKLSKK